MPDPHAPGSRPANEYVLPNGCTLRPGGRIRIASDQLALIPDEDWGWYGITIGADFSHGSEVIEWPLAV